MYLLYLSSISFIFITLLKCLFFKNVNINYKKFDYKNKYYFTIKNIEFFKDNNKIEVIEYNKNYFNQFKFELDIDFVCDYYVINYIYNNIEYKYYSNNDLLTFPIYKSGEIKNFVYINKITNAVLIINNNNNNKENEILHDEEEFDILNDLLKFVGPNYNFYKDLDIKFNIDIFLKYIYVDNPILKKLDFINKNYYIKLCDNFNTIYKIESDYLNWVPDLKL